MDPCPHGMEPSWCYVCRIESSGVEPRIAWGLDAWDGPAGPWRMRTAPMTDDQEDLLRFLCHEFGESFDGTLTEGEAGVVIESFLGEPMVPSQLRTLEHLSARAGREVESDLSYGRARTRIRQLIAQRALRTA
jgi:hypothetical protein